MGYQKISAGIFQMGCLEDNEDTFECWKDDYHVETPIHTVEITRAFALMKTEVTQELYETVMRENPSDLDYGSDYPIEAVNWFDTIRFANELSRLEGREERYSILGWRDSGTTVDWIGLDCNSGWRLPTEAEWEYAARGNEKFPFMLAQIIRMKWLGMLNLITGQVILHRELLKNSQMVLIYMI